MKQIPQIQKVMTMMPHTINANVTLKTAQQFFREYGIRHLPVLDGGALVGVLSDRDVKLAASFTEGSELTVGEVMTPDPYCVDPSEALDEVVLTMAEHKYGAAIVRLDNGKVVGIFTAVDALRVLGEVLEQNYKRGVK